MSRAYMITLIVLMIVLTFLAVATIIKIINIDKASFVPKNYDAKIDYTNISSEKKTEINKLISELDSRYLSTAKSIEFTDKKSDITLERDGQNLNGNIIIYAYSGRLKFLICHELLHNIVKYEPDKDQYFTVKLANEGVCYD